MAKYYDLLKQLIEGQINRRQYDKLVSDRDKAEAAKSLPSDAKLFKLAEQQEAKQKAQEAKQKAKDELISMLPKEDQEAMKPSIDTIIENISIPSDATFTPSFIPTGSTGLDLPKEIDKKDIDNTYTIFDMYGNESAFKGTSAEFAEFMTGNPKYYATIQDANKALSKFYASRGDDDAGNGATTAPTTTGAPDKLYWGRYDSGSWATSTEAGKPEGFTWGWELPEFAGLGQDDFSSNKSLQDILGQVTDGASTGGATEPPVVTGGETTTDFGRMGSQIWQDATGQKYLTFGIPGTNMFIRYKASDDELSGFFTTGMPGIRNISEDEEDWNNSLWLGGYNEIDGDIKLGLSNPFDTMVDNFAKVKKVQPWMETDELYSLWLEGIVEDRTIADYEWQGTEWWQTHTQEQRDWLLTSQGQDIDNLPADAKAFLDNNRIRAAEILRQNGVSNADEVVNADGDSLVEFFATQLTTGNWTELTWARQAQGLGDPLAGIERDNQLITWLEGTQELPIETTQAGYAQVKSLAQKWLGPNFAEFENANLDEYAGILRNAESEAVGIAMIEDKLKNIRKALFTTDLYEENLTYEDIASPWRNYSYQYLGERMDETSAEWLNILKANDQEKINTILTEYGLNNGNQTMFDKVTDGIVEGIAAPVVRGMAT